jgi:two-component system LytT family response regulator
VWYERAVALYRGEYLQNMYYEWVFPERRRLVQSYLTALQELTTYHLSNQSPKQAVACIEKAIPLDRLNEDLYCHAMRAYAALNHRTNISRIYDDLKRLLHTELNTVPLIEIDKLYHELIG